MAPLRCKCHTEPCDAPALADPRLHQPLLHAGRFPRVRREMFGSGVRQSGRLDVSRLTEAVLQDAVPRSVGVALVEATREAAAAAAGQGSDGRGQGQGAGEWDPQPMAEAMAVFRPQELSAAEGLLPV